MANVRVRLCCDPDKATTVYTFVDPVVFQRSAVASTPIETTADRTIWNAKHSDVHKTSDFPSRARGLGTTIVRRVSIPRHTAYAISCAPVSETNAVQRSSLRVRNHAITSDDIPCARTARVCLLYETPCYDAHSRSLIWHPGVCVHAAAVLLYQT